MLGDRLDELTQSANAPFLRADADRELFPIARTRDEARLGALVSNDGAARGLEALVTELQRVAQFGFTATELDRAKQSMMAGSERVVTESPDRLSASRADEYTRNFLEDEALPTIWQELAFHRRFVPGSHARRDQRAHARLVSRCQPADCRVGAGGDRRAPAESNAAGEAVVKTASAQTARALRGCRRRSGAHGRAAATRDDREDDGPFGHRHHRVDAVERRDRRVEADDAAGRIRFCSAPWRRAARRWRRMRISFPRASRTWSCPPAASAASTSVVLDKILAGKALARPAVHRRNQRGHAGRQHAAGSRDDDAADVSPIHAAARRSGRIRCDGGAGEKPARESAGESRCRLRANHRRDAERESSAATLRDARDRGPVES